MELAVAEHARADAERESYEAVVEVGRDEELNEDDALLEQVSTRGGSASCVWGVGCVGGRWRGEERWREEVEGRGEVERGGGEEVRRWGGSEGGEREEARGQGGRSGAGRKRAMEFRMPEAQQHSDSSKYRIFNCGYCGG